jgi:hypothetical protein
MNYFSKRSGIYVGDNADLAYWTKKWRVNAQQINEAILETGSVNLKDIKNVLKKKGRLNRISFWINRFSKRA